MKTQHKKKLKKKDRSLSKIIGASSSAPDLMPGQSVENDAKPNIHEGWLEKRSGSKFSAKRWKRRYFVLTAGAELIYFEDERCRSQPGVVDLVGSKVVRPAKYLAKYGEHPDSSSEIANVGRRRGSSLASIASTVSSQLPPPSVQPPVSPSAASSTTGMGIGGLPMQPPLVGRSRRGSSRSLTGGSLPTFAPPTLASASSSSSLPRFFVLEIVNARRSWTLRSDNWEELETWFALLTELQRSTLSSAGAAVHSSSVTLTQVEPLLVGSAPVTPGSSVPSSGTSTPSHAQQRQLSPQLTGSDSSLNPAAAHAKPGGDKEFSRASQHSGLFPVGTSSSSSANQHTNMSVSQVGSVDNECSVSYRSAAAVSDGRTANDSDNDSDASSVATTQRSSSNWLRRGRGMPRRSRTSPPSSAASSPTTGTNRSTAAAAAPPSHSNSSKSSSRFFHRSKAVPPRSSEKFVATRAATAGASTPSSQRSTRTPVINGGPAFFDDDETKDGSPRFDPRRIDSLWAPIVDDMIQREGRSFFELIDEWEKQRADKDAEVAEQAEAAAAAARQQQQAEADVEAASKSSNSGSAASASSPSTLGATAAQAAVAAAPSAPSAHDKEKIAMASPHNPLEPFTALSIVTPAHTDIVKSSTAKPHHVRHNAQTHTLVPMLSPVKVSRTLPRLRPAQIGQDLSKQPPLPSRSAPSSPRVQGGLPPPPGTHSTSSSHSRSGGGLPPPPLTSVPQKVASPRESESTGSAGDSLSASTKVRSGGRWSSRKEQPRPPAVRPDVRSVLVGVGQRFEIVLDDEYEALFDEDDRVRQEKNDAMRQKKKQQQQHQRS